jgi:hypothetical protein
MTRGPRESFTVYVAYYSILSPAGFDISYQVTLRSVAPATPGGPPPHCGGYGQAGVQFNLRWIPAFVILSYDSSRRIATSAAVSAGLGNPA